MKVWCDQALIIAPVDYGLCASEAVFHRELRKMGVPKADWPRFVRNEWSNATAHTFANDNGRLSVLVCIGDVSGRTGVEIAGLIVHEATHIWQQMRKRIGERKPSHEFEAYSIQCISQRLMESFASQVTM